MLGAIAEPNRFAIVEFLRDGPHTVSEMVEQLALNQPLVSKHLRVLRTAGIVERHQSAQLRIYALKPQPFEALDTWTGTFRGLWEGRLDALDAYVREFGKEDQMSEDIVIRRIIEAPVDLVWSAWTVPENVRRWWGPKYYTATSCTIDLREGGRYLFAMRAPREQGGNESFTAGTYTRIERNRILEFTQYLADGDGNPLDPSDAGMPEGFPKEMQTVVTFEAMGGLTRLTVTIHGWTENQMFVFAYAGWHQQMDKFEASLPMA